MRSCVKTIFATTLAALLCCVGTVAQAQDCSLKQIASLPITITAYGHIAVPLKVNGVDRLFVVSLHVPYSAVTQQFAIDARLHTSDKPGPLYAGIVTTATRTATASDLEIGALDLKDVAFADMVIDLGGPTETGGVLGYEFFKQFDVEFDFARGKLNLYSHDHCAGKVVYWASAYAVMPFQIVPFPQGFDGAFNNMAGVVTQATLDGKPLTVGLSFEPGDALMERDIAAGVTGLSDDALKATSVPPTSEFAYGSFHYPFKALSLGGVAIGNPAIDMYTHDACTRHFGVVGMLGTGSDRFCVADLWLRLSEIRKLHLYFAFGENKLYVTAADAHR